MLKVWILTLVFTSGSGSSVSTQQYQFSSRSECLKAGDYMMEKNWYAKSGICLLTDKP